MTKQVRSKLSNVKFKLKTYFIEWPVSAFCCYAFYGGRLTGKKENNLKIWYAKTDGVEVAVATLWGIARTPLL